MRSTSRDGRTAMSNAPRRGVAMIRLRIGICYLPRTMIRR
jgi:hypothetical protein